MFKITETHSRYDHILHTLLDFGEMMIESGAEVNRVEDSLTRLGVSYGASKINVYAVTAHIIISLIDTSGITHTQLRRLESVACTDFSRLEKLNGLSRAKCSGKIDETQFEESFEALKEYKPNQLKLYIGSMLAAGAFAVFFGGTVPDGLAAVVFAVLIYFMQSKFRSFCPNTIIFNLLTSFLVGICICFTSQLFSLNADKIIIGDIMLLIPGIAFTNSIRNLLVGDTNTGVIRMVETILWAASLALGFVLSMMLIGV